MSSAMVLSLFSLIGCASTQASKCDKSDKAHAKKMSCCQAAQ